jgi:hypothetical protein
MHSLLLTLSEKIVLFYARLIDGLQCKSLKNRAVPNVLKKFNLIFLFPELELPGIIIPSDPYIPYPTWMPGNKFVKKETASAPSPFFPSAWQIAK